MAANLDEVAARKVAMQPLLGSYIGNHRSSLPTPSLCISLPTLKRNSEIFHKSIEGLNVTFRAHVKTHKTIEATKIELGPNYHSVITSTLREIRGLKELIDDGTVTDILYGLPPAASYVAALSSLSNQIPNLRLLIDHPAQLTSLEALPPLARKPWSVFIKLDTGYHRAGLDPSSNSLKELLEKATNCKNIDIFGFYAHAGDSYSAKSEDDSVTYLTRELETVTLAVQVLEEVLQSTGAIPGTKPLVLSIGATPTAHVVSKLKDPKALGVTIPENCKLEIHAGNFPFNDLQQLATGVVPTPPEGGSSLACTANAEVVSVYPDRNEALINAGVLALGREPGQISGFGRVRGNERWIVGRVSQEHGILALDKSDTTSEGSEKVEEAFKVGDNLSIDIQHACIAAASHDWFFVIDEEEVVRDVWYPWRGWQ